MEQYLPLIISLISGAVGGNVAGAVLKNLSLGTVINSIVGIVGGGLGSQLLGMAGIGVASGMDLAGIIGNVASSGVGGAVLLAIIGFIKKLVAK